jgi:DNA-binding CsgD family transcriptional regulator/GAF domain-containing protein
LEIYADRFNIWQVIFSQIYAVSSISKELHAISRIFQIMMQYNTDDLTIEGHVLEACLECTESIYGMVGIINKGGEFDATTYSSRTLFDCAFPAGLTSQLTTGMDIRGVWGMPMFNNEPLICNDITSHPERVGFPEGHVPLNNFLGVPLQRSGQAIGMLAVANKNTDYSNEDKNTLVRLAAIISLGSDLRRKILQIQLAEADLEKGKQALEEMNAALTVLLKKREEDKTEFEEKMLSNTNTLILPYLQKLEQITIDDRQRTYLRVIEANIKEMLSPLAFRLSSKFHGLTPTEIKISSLIKNGETNKEIAKILNASIKTVEFHRDNLRKKFGIKNQKVNLRTYLLSLA